MPRHGDTIFKCPYSRRGREDESSLIQLMMMFEIMMLLYLCLLRFLLLCREYLYLRSLPLDGYLSMLPSIAHHYITSVFPIRARRIGVCLDRPQEHASPTRHWNRRVLIISYASRSATSTSHPELSLVPAPETRTPTHHSQKLDSPPPSPPPTTFPRPRPPPPTPAAHSACLTPTAYNPRSTTSSPSATAFSRSHPARVGRPTRCRCTHPPSAL